MDRQRITMVEMERLLLNDVSGDYRRSLLDKLAGYKSELVYKLNSGLSLDRFEVYNRIKVALEKAQEVIKKFK
ncbi:MAG: EscE/YscE/SsaE family type III secretion system needle protein co-chaperone [Puniceicoccales bacterium]|jgi:hypothetical protein|nr:EscE/YscE/SsaE family type III secretion system needle protein co-chaperone [Puniceicoccales bacterium]